MSQIEAVKAARIIGALGYEAEPVKVGGVWLVDINEADAEDVFRLFDWDTIGQVRF